MVPKHLAEAYTVVAAAEVESLATSTTTGVVHPAVVEAVKCYGKPVHIKKPWLTWLEGCIQASKITGKLFHSTRGMRGLCGPRRPPWHFLLNNN